MRVDRRRPDLTIIAAGLAAYGLHLQPPYPYAALLYAVPRLWQAWFITAAALTLAWAVWPDHRLYLTSGVVTAGAFVTRGLAHLVAPNGAGWRIALLFLAVSVTVVRTWQFYGHTDG